MERVNNIACDKKNIFLAVVDRKEMRSMQILN